tara:strand:- start:4247 stop:4654 length:408 start_codon:yes stop_codon:yes gene_type:complete
MGKINHTSQSIDVGIVTYNPDKMLDFYSNTLGLIREAEIPFPNLGVVNKFVFGDGYLKILVLESEPQNQNIIGNFTVMNGIRYITINLSNIEEIISECKKNNIVIVNEPIEIRPKVTVAVIQDPDGNLIEMMQSN